MGIDEIMDMLDENKPKEEQEKAYSIAKDIKCINVFLQPCHMEHNKNVWNNCARVLADRGDDELKPYLVELFRWLQDQNWPGFDIIKNRLKKYNHDKYFFYVLSESIAIAKALKDDVWLNNLRELV